MTEMVQLVPAWHPYQSSLDQPFLAASLTIGTLSQKPRQSPPRGTTAKLAKLLKTSIMATPWPSHTANRQEDTLDTRSCSGVYYFTSPEPRLAPLRFTDNSSLCNCCGSSNTLPSIAHLYRAHKPGGGTELSNTPCIEQLSAQVTIPPPCHIVESQPGKIPNQVMGKWLVQHTERPVGFTY